MNSFILILALAVLGRGSEAASGNFDDLTRQAGSAYQSGRLEEAASLFRQAAAVAPDDLNTKRSLGNVLYHRGHFSEAAKVLRVAVRAEPHHRATRKVLSDALAAAGNLRTALWHFGQIPFLPKTALPPLSPALAAPWRWEPQAQQLPWELRGRPRGSQAPFFLDLGQEARKALEALRSFLDGVLGEAYGFEFRSASVELRPDDARDLLEQALWQLRRLLPEEVRQRANCAEWWVHRRPPKSIPEEAEAFGLEGHPLHWDNDGEEAAGQKPLMTSLLYLTGASKKGGAAAPTLVLNTTKEETGFYVGDVAWVMHAAEGRVAHVPGGMLHGVLPSAGSIKGAERGLQRLSLNVAWWPHHCRRKDAGGSATQRPLPPPVDPLWHAEGEDALKAMMPRAVTGIFCNDKETCRPPRSEL